MLVVLVVSSVLLNTGIASRLEEVPVAWMGWD